VEFNDKKIAEFVGQHGVTVKYYQATLCPCVEANNGHPDPKCGCNNGFWYAEPKQYKLLRSGINFKNLSTDVGRILQGGCQFTIPPRDYSVGCDGEAIDLYDAVAFGDVFVLPNRNRKDRDILQRGVRDEIRSFDVQQILSITKGLTKYLPDIDYKFTNGVSINWLTGKGPATDEFYTVEYLCNIQYFVWDTMAKDRGTDETILPKAILCALRQFVNFKVSAIDNLILG